MATSFYHTYSYNVSDNIRPGARDYLDYLKYRFKLTLTLGAFAPCFVILKNDLTKSFISKCNLCDSES